MNVFQSAITAASSLLSRLRIGGGEIPVATVARALLDTRNTPVVLPITTAVTPLTGATITAKNLGTEEVIYITPAGTLAALTFVFPTDANSRVGQIIQLISTQIITALTVTSTNLTLNGTAVTALSANVPVTWKKVAAATWSRLSGGALGAVSVDSLASAGAITGTSIAGTGAVTSSSPAVANGVGYATGAGVAATQGTSATTTVVGNGKCGTIALFATQNVAAAAEQVFTFTNSAIGANDVVSVHLHSGTPTGTPLWYVSSRAVGTCTITMTNLHTATAETGAALVLAFTVHRAVAS